MNSPIETPKDPDKQHLPAFIPEDGPFNQTQRTFLNGLLAGLSTNINGSKSETESGTPLAIFFASQTGTAEALSKKVKKLAAGKGFDATVAELNSTSLTELANLRHALFITATSGDGEPPDNAHTFYTALLAEDAAPLPATLHYSVCGLGDSSYSHFNLVCQTLDSRLEQLGATRTEPPVFCDVDYDDDFEQWHNRVFDSEIFTEAAGAPASVADSAEPPAPAYDKHRPFLGTLMASEPLSARCSAKKINHIEIALTGGGQDMDFDVGDALGMWPLNDLTEVKELLDLTGFSGAELVTFKKETTPLRQALHSGLDLSTLTDKALQLWQLQADASAEVVDVLESGDHNLTPQQLVDGLRPLQPRLYSICSSPNKHPGEVHLTVGEVHYELHGKTRQGVASTYLGSRLAPGNQVGVYVQRASHFALPEDDNQPLIMIGPGTGIAPFRAFLEEREVRQAEGKNWLFFGDQHEASDYLYQQQICSWRKAGLLNRLSLAWSRDAQEKVYVQHLIEKEGADFFRWLENGAAIYICGDATQMAPDVEQSILRVIAEHGALSEPQAVEYLDNLRQSHRYQRDVY